MGLVQVTCVDEISQYAIKLQTLSKRCAACADS